MGKNNKAFQFRIYPTEEQKELFEKTFGCCRFIYNQMLSDKNEEYKKTGKMLKTTPAAYKKEFPWLKEVDSLALANVQLHLERAYRNFFERPEIGFPKFKSKHRSRNAYTTNLVNGNIRLFENGIKLPKAGVVKAKIHRQIPEGFRMKAVTVRRQPSGKYYVSILFEYCADENQVRDREERERKVIGIDYAMHGLAVFSDGSKGEYPDYYRRSEKRLNREQRKLSHCKRGSSNYQKQKKRVALCHEKVKNQRRDFHHKLSRKLAEEYDVVAVEDLNMKEMSRCLNFGKSVADNGYGMLLNMLSYKLEDRGGKLVKVDRFFPSSKRCSKCGKVKKVLPLSERAYRCECGYTNDRDVNAAINIREEAIRLLSA